MTQKTCGIPTIEQRLSLEIREAAERTMLEKVFKAIDEAANEVSQKYRDENLNFEPTDRDYFMFTVQQMTFVSLCGANPETFDGGDPEIGKRIVSNGQYIIDNFFRR